MNNKTGFVFSGQGTQYAGMCQELYSNDPIVKECFDKASEILGYDLADVCFGSSRDRLGSTSGSQPAIFVASVAQMKLFSEKSGLAPRFALGNSIGEYAALVCAGVLSFEDALRLVKVRGELMEKAALSRKGVMFDVKNVSADVINEAINEFSSEGIVCISNYNGRNNCVISGEEIPVQKTADRLAGKGARVIQLNVSSGFHSPLMQEAAESFAAELEKYTFSDPQCVLLSNVTGKPYLNGDDIKKTIASQITSAVQWYSAVKYMEENGCTDVIEFGAKKTLRNLISNNSGMTAYSYDAPDDRAFLDRIYNRKDMQLRAFGGFLRAAVDSKNMNDDEAGYAREVIATYRENEAVYNRMKNEDYTVTAEELSAARERLLRTLSFKKAVNAAEICDEIYKNAYSVLIDRKEVE